MNKYQYTPVLMRREAILKIVSLNQIHSQEELASRLKEQGLDAAQATLSRDIKELGLVKGASGYMAPVSGGVAGPGNGGARDAGRLSRVMRDSVLSIETAASQVVIKTPPAEAQTVGRILDQAGIEEVVGTIAGDDTIFLAAGGVDAAVRIRDRLLAMAGMQGRDSSSRTR